MQIVINNRNAISLSKEVAHDRLRFSLRRLSAWIRRANVDFVDVNGPRGGQDKQCRLELTTSKFGLVVVSARAGDWRMALNKAVARAVRKLMSSVKRPLAKRQPSPRETFLPQ
ncbi:HPF/RaiA family ribosome-associated protein [Acidovorax sp.]|uniref:HPF/RaiA family ribosome-associated protein n=1 Tax=Acidovorax sp. TaxID=1872122 RepID=UPI00391EF7A3